MVTEKGNGCHLMPGGLADRKHLPQHVLFRKYVCLMLNITKKGKTYSRLTYFPCLIPPTTRVQNCNQQYPSNITKVQGTVTLLVFTKINQLSINFFQVCLVCTFLPISPIRRSLPYHNGKTSKVICMISNSITLINAT